MQSATHEDDAAAPSELKQLIDRSEIVDLISRLGVMLDEKRLEDVGSIFSDDVIAHFPSGPLNGAEALADQGRRSLAPFELIQHLITNVLVDLDGDRAAVRANLIAVHVQRAEEPASHFDVGCVYRMEAVRTADGWRVSRIELRPLWTGGSVDERWLAREVPRETSRSEGGRD